MKRDSLVPKATNYKNVKPLTAEQIQNMTKKQIRTYYKGALRANRANIRASKALAKQANFAKYAQAKMLNDTIRQGLAEVAGTATTAIVGKTATSNSGNKNDASIRQNIQGGISEVTEAPNANTGQFVDTENGPVYSENARKED